MIKGRWEKWIDISSIVWLKNIYLKQELFGCLDETNLKHNPTFSQMKKSEEVGLMHLGESNERHQSQQSRW